MADDEAYDYGRLLVLQHADHTGPSNLVPALDGRANKRPWDLLRPDQGDALPDSLDGIAGLLVLGGPMGVHDVDQHAWIEPELDLIRRAVEGGTPVLGICLGHQMLATALGGRVETRGTPEIGLLPLRRTDAAQDDEVFAGYTDEAVQIVIHDDEVVELPDGAEVMLEGSAGTTAFRAADGMAYGVQFHPETSADLFSEWTRRPDNLARFEAAGVDPEQMAQDVQDRARFLRAVGVSLVGRWLDGVVGADDPMPRRRPKKD